jgi:hypothetical protein
LRALVIPIEFRFQLGFSAKAPREVRRNQTLRRISSARKEGTSQFKNYDEIFSPPKPTEPPGPRKAAYRYYGVVGCKIGYFGAWIVVSQVLDCTVIEAYIPYEECSMGLSGVIAL